MAPVRVLVLALLAMAVDGRLGEELMLLNTPKILNTDELGLVDLRPRILINEVITSPPSSAELFISMNTSIAESGRLAGDDIDTSVDKTSAVSCASTDCSYSCEALHVCRMPSASAKDYWDSHITVRETFYELQNGKAVELESCCNTDQPSTFLMKYDATDKAGNKAEQITIQLIVLGACRMHLLS